jgi:hypothetical protein
MTTFTGVGPAGSVDGPLPVAPKHGLLTIPGVAEEGEGRWENGVVVDGYADHAPSLWEPCATGTFRVKDDGDEGPKPRFDPIVVYYPLSCSTHGMANPERIRDRADRLLEATLSFGVEMALAQGVTLSTNAYLGDGNLVALAGSPVAPKVGLRYLENAIGATGRKGLIHATPAVVAEWFGDPQTDAVQLVTANGTPVAAGGGYIGTDPVSEPSPATTVDWVFATGPVKAFLAELERIEVAQAVDRSINLASFRAERAVLVEWDTSLQVGIRIDWSL